MKKPEEIIKSEGLFRAAKYTSNHIIALISRIQSDARKDGLMSAQLIASKVILAESPKYATGAPNEGVSGQSSLSGLDFKISDAIVTEADKLNYLP